MATPFNRKPVNLLCSDDLDSQNFQTAQEAIEELATLADVKLEIRKAPSETAKILLDAGRKAGRKGQLNAHQMLRQLAEKLVAEQTTIPRYDVLLTEADLYAPGLNFLFGVGQPLIGFVFSFHRFKQLPTKKWAQETAKTVIMHEMGHVFNLPIRAELTEENLGTHCLNKCLMRQGLSLNAMQKIAKDRVKGYVLCQLCQEDLIRHFWKKS